MKLLQANT